MKLVYPIEECVELFLFLFLFLALVPTIELEWLAWDEKI
jgi:hypothetical protein